MTGLALWRDRLSLEQFYVRAIHSNCLYIIGFAGFAYLLWSDSLSVVRGTVRESIQSKCLSGDTLVGNGYYGVVWQDSTRALLIIPIHGILSYVTRDTCEVHSISYTQDLMSIRLVVTGILVLQVCIDLYIALPPKRLSLTHSSTIRFSPSYIEVSDRSHLDELIVLTCSSACMCLLLADLALPILLGDFFLSYVNDAIILLFSGNDGGIETVRLVFQYKESMLGVGSLVFLLGVVRLLLIASIHPRLSLLTSTLYAGFTEVLSIISILFFIFTIFGISGFYLFGESVPEFATFPLALWSQFQMLLSDWPFDNLFSSTNIVAVYLYTLSFGFVVIFTLLRVYLAMVLEAFDASQGKIARINAHRSVFADVWMLIAETCIGFARKWPNRSDVIQHLQVEGREIPEKYHDMQRFYMNNFPEITYADSNDSDSMQQLKDQWQTLNSASLTELVSNDPYLKATRDLRTRLQEVKTRMRDRMRMSNRSAPQSQKKAKSKRIPSTLIVKAPPELVQEPSSSVNCRHAYGQILPSTEH